LHPAFEGDNAIGARVLYNFVPSILASFRRFRSLICAAPFVCKHM